MQARIWAQGLTIGVLMASAGKLSCPIRANPASPELRHAHFIVLAQRKGHSYDEPAQAPADHSWVHQLQAMQDIQKKQEAADKAAQKAR